MNINVLVTSFPVFGFDWKGFWDKGGFTIRYEMAFVMEANEIRVMKL